MREESAGCNGTGRRHAAAFSRSRVGTFRRRRLETRRRRERKRKKREKNQRHALRSMMPRFFSPISFPYNRVDLG